MNKARLLFFSLAGLLLVLLSVFLLRREGSPLQAEIVTAAGPGTVSADPAGFKRVEAPQEFHFPSDYGPHPDYQTEWWYYTGNLRSSNGHAFGYQLTFFRRALLPPGQRIERASDWGTSQVYMAHFALTDVGAAQYSASELLSRGAAGLAGAQTDPYRVWLEDWSVEASGPGQYHLVAKREGISVDLQLVDRKGPVLQGDQGYSRKGPEPGNASNYYSLTRLETQGTVESAGNRYAVSGLSWMDHEWSTSALSSGQVGWDWFSIQLGDSSELMLFQIRRSDGSIDPFSSGTYIAPDGTTTPLNRDDFTIIVEDRWRSPRSGAVYPARWRLQIPNQDLELHITPLLADQELNVSYSYWEGAVSIRGKHSSQEISGYGYVELTGYSRSMSGEF